MPGSKKNRSKPRKGPFYGNQFVNADGTPKVQPIESSDPSEPDTASEETAGRQDAQEPRAEKSLSPEISRPETSTSKKKPGRRKKRAFFGNKYVNADGSPKARSTQESTGPSESETGESVGPSQATQEYAPRAEHTEWIKPEGNLIFAASQLLNSIAGLIHCPSKSCNGRLELEESDSPRGWAVLYRWSCGECGFEKPFSNSTHLNQQPQLNIQLATALRSTGQNQFQFANFCTIMSLHQPPDRLIDLERKILPVMEEVAEKSMNRWTQKEVESTGSSDLLVSVDGTWQKRGFSSRNGISVIASPVTGKILDCEAKTNYCGKCHGDQARRGDPDDPEAVTCDCNHRGSAGAMESQGD